MLEKRLQPLNHKATKNEFEKFIKMIKKAIIALVILGFLATNWVLVTKFRTMQTADKRPKTEQEIQKIAFYKKHSKQLGQSFTVDSIEICVDSFDFISTDVKTVLYCKLSLTNKSVQKHQITSSFFALKNDVNKVFYPKEGSLFLLPNATQKQVIVYNLPPRVLPYLNYFLHFESKINKVEKAIISVSKSYRSEG